MTSRAKSSDLDPPSRIETVVDAAPFRPKVVKSAGRVLEILEFFDDVRREAPIAEIAQRLRYPHSSTAALLKTLTELGYLDFDPYTRTYLPSPQVTLLGTWLDGGPVRDGSLVRMMEELARQTGDSVILAVRNGIYSQFINVVQARTEMRFHIPQGSRRLVVWSATGFALLQSETAETIQALVRRTNAEASAGQRPTDPRRTLAYVREARERGYAFSRGLVTPGAGSIAIPLPQGVDKRNRPLVVALSGPLKSFVAREEEIVMLMRHSISRFIRVVAEV